MSFDNEIIFQTYDLTEMINNSEEVIEYLKYKKEVENNQEVTNLRKKLRQAKELFEETQRFGNFHPNYNEAKEMVDKVLAEINSNELIKKYKKAEDEINSLLYMVANILSESVSPSIKVPRSNNLLDDPFCTTGNCNTCGIKGSCAI